MNIKLPFKVKCVDDDSSSLTLGKEYEVITVEGGFYKVRNDCGITWWYYDSRFEMVETPLKDKQEFSVGDKVVINKIPDYYIPLKDVKVGDIATVTWVGNQSFYGLRLTNPNWLNSWCFSKTDVSLVADNNPLNDKSQDYHILSHQEVVQAVIDGKEIEIQYTDGTWHRMLSTITTLRQLTTLNFRLKPESSLEDKRKAIIKKLLENKVAVLCKCWDDDDIGEEIAAITDVNDDYTYPYISNNGGYKNAYAINDNGNEITNV